MILKKPSSIFLILIFIVILTTAAQSPATYPPFLPPLAGCTNATVTTQAELEAIIIEYNSECGAGTTLTATVNGTITLGSALSAVNNTTTAVLEIVGDGDDILDGANNFRILEITEGNVTIDKLTLQNGDAGTGGAIFNNVNGAVTITNSTFTGNTANSGGAIRTNGEMTITNSTITDNYANNDAGGIYNFGPLEIINTTITSNTAERDAGGIFADNTGSLTMTNTTVTNNIGGTGSSGSTSGGLVIQDGGSTTLNNNIIANNTFDGSANDCYRFTGSVNFSAGTSNLIEEDSDTNACGTADVNYITADPDLGALADNGGDVQTMLPDFDSPVINIGDTSTAPAEDARGISRPQGAADDLGAVEVVASACQNNTATDQGELEEAIAAYNVNCDNGDTLIITVDGTITLSSNPIRIRNVTTAVLEIVGDGDDVLDGAGNHQILSVTDGTVTIDTLTFQNGAANDGNGRNGGAIFNDDNGVLTITNSTFDNSSASLGGALFNNNAGVITITNSTFTNNRASTDGGVIDNRGTLSMTNSTLTGNYAGREGGAIYVSQGTATITNSTIVNNTAKAASSGGGLHHRTGNTTLNNVILANNFVDDGAADGDCYEQTNNVNFSTGTTNLIKNDSSSDPCGTAGSNYITDDPVLGDLADNGGPVHTIPLLIGSPAIDIGDAATAPAEDARGVARPQFGTDDLGAYEIDNLTPTIQITIDAAEISENGGVSTAAISRNSTSGNLTINLSSNDPGEATVPTSVTIADGDFKSAAFNITGVDELLDDGTQTVTITASAAGFSNATNTINITDDDDPILTLTIDQASISENEVGTATVSRNSTAGNLTVNLSSNDTGEATVPVSVTIADGDSDSPSFNITAVNDNLPDGTQTITITASAAGFSNVTDTIDITPGCSDVTVATQTELENAITAYNNDCGNGDTMTVTVNGTITLSSALSGINNTTTAILELVGDGDDALDGADSYQILDISSASEVVINTLTLQNGFDNGGGGGAIETDGSLTILNSTFSDNSTSLRGGVIFVGAGTTTVSNSRFSGNEATSDGGAIHVNFGTTTIINSTFTGNSGSRGSAISASNGTTNIIHSTLTGNISSTGSTIFGSFATLNITNSTISGNEAADSDIGAGVYTLGTLNLSNTILANSVDSGGNPLPDCYEQAGNVNFSSDSSNLIETETPVTSRVCGTAGTDFIEADPNLGPLQDNGGSVQTMALLANSPALNAGNNASAVDADSNPLTTDARGTGFNRTVNGTVDLGAFESQQTITIAFTAATTSGAESVTNPTILTLTTSDGEPSLLDITLDLAVSGAQTADYTLPDAAVSIPASTASGTPVSFQNTDFAIVDDSLEEFSEPLTLTLSNASGATLGSQTTTTYTITDNDGAPPSLVSLSPADDAINIAVNSNLILTFDETVQAGTGNIELRLASNNSLVESFDIASSGRITFSTTTVTSDTITINPTADLTEQTTYYVTVPSIAITDLVDKPFAGLTTTAAWNFTTGDFTAPTLLSLTPTDNAANVAVNVDLVLVFDEAMQVGSGNIELRTVISDTLIESFDVTSSGQITLSTTTVPSDTLTINPTNDLNEQTAYYVTVPDTALTDVSVNTNPFAGLLVSTDWNFTTGDFTAPTLLTLTPADDETNATTDTTLTLIFDEPMQAGSGTIELREATSGNLIESFDIASGSLITFTTTTVPSDTLIISPTSTLAEQRAYYVTVPTTALTDASVNTNPFDGLLTTTEWNFTTGDFTAPTLLNQTPADDSTNIALNTNLTLIFDESMQAGLGTIELREVGSGALFESFDIVSSGRITFATTTVPSDTMIIDTTSNLAETTTYYITVPTTALTDISFNANPFAGLLTAADWNFTTGDFTAPEMTSLTPADNDTNTTVDSNLVIVFDVSIQAGTGTIELREASNGALVESFDIASSNQITFSTTAVATDTITINPAAPLAEQTGYYVTVSATAVTDISVNRNPFPGILTTTEWNFTTGDFTPPTRLTLSPADDQTNVALASDLVLTFDEPIQTGTGLIELREVDGGALVESFDVSTSNRLTISSTTVPSDTVIINPTAMLNEQTAYYMVIPATAITDRSINANPFAGLLTSAAWNFTTGDFTAPSLLALTPADDETNVTTDTNLVLLFDESVQAGTGLIELRTANDDLLIESFDIVANNQITFATTNVPSDTIIINPTADLAETTSYYVTIPATALTDLSPNLNPFTGLLTNTEWNFTTGDITSPALLSLSPADDATDVSIDTNLVLIFDETMQAGTGQIELRTVNGDTLIESFDIATSDRIAFSSTTIPSDTLTIDPSVTLQGSIAYYVTAPAAILTDSSLNANPFAGLTENTRWNFTTANTAVYLPFVTTRGYPDLVVESVVATADSLEVTIRNIGTAAVVDDFYVDAYIGLNDPTQIPTTVNDIWQDFSPQGVVWGIITADSPIASGETLTLSLNDTYQITEFSDFSLPLASGTPIYIQVDSANAGNDAGAVLEQHEESGGVYNNIARSIIVP